MSLSKGKGLVTDLIVSFVVGQVLLLALYMTMLSTTAPAKYSTLTIIIIEVILLVSFFFFFLLIQRETDCCFHSWVILFLADLLPFAWIFNPQKFFYENTVRYPYIISVVCVLVGIALELNLDKVRCHLKNNKRKIRMFFKHQYTGFSCHFVAILDCVLLCWLLSSRFFPVILGVLFSLILLLSVAAVVFFIGIDSISVILVVAVISLCLCIFIVFPFFQGIGSEFVFFVLTHRTILYASFYSLGAILGHIVFVKKYSCLYCG